MIELMFAAFVFVTAHLAVSNSRLRPMLIRRLSTGGYAALYSVIAVLTLVLFVMAYNEASRLRYLWPLDPMLYWVPKVLMPAAFIFLAGGIFGATATADSLAGCAKDDAALARLTGGINRITRHPVQWGIALWAATHLAANGDIASVAFFCGFLTLSLAGSWFADRKKAEALGNDWRAFAASSSYFPFVAIAAGRNRFVWRELTLPTAVGVALYLALFWGHGWVSGVEVYW